MICTHVIYAGPTNIVKCTVQKNTTNVLPKQKMGKNVNRFKRENCKLFQILYLW
jgi:hypothetical protein